MGRKKSFEKSIDAINKFGKVSGLFLNAEFPIWLGSKNNKQTNKQTNKQQQQQQQQQHTLKVYATFKPWHMVYPGFKRVCSNKLQ